jgi:CRISPR system Cascade subunit CasD
MRKITDFHTVMAARKVDGKANSNPVISRREYLCDQQFTVALQFAENAVYSLSQLAEAVQKPYYTPFLGRRSCPLTAPLFVEIRQAKNLHQALNEVSPGKEKIFSELPPDNDQVANHIEVRDRRVFTGKRRFEKRSFYIHGEAD